MARQSEGISIKFGIGGGVRIVYTKRSEVNLILVRNSNIVLKGRFPIGTQHDSFCSYCYILHRGTFRVKYATLSPLRPLVEQA
jgi:hypothetical protein